MINRVIPDVWTTAAAIIPKKGDHGISLVPVAAKVINKLLLNKVHPHLDPLLRPDQNGFRKGRSTLPQILAIRRILEE